MSVTTHYTALGLVPSAAPEVIRAAYKALALIYHPDKTLHLAAEERASYAAVFREVQEAYDLLRNPSLKAAYDAELTPLHYAADKTRSSYQRRPSTRSAARTQPVPQRKQSIKLTTPEEKASLRATARHSLEQLRERRVERDSRDAQLDISGLRDMVHIWEQLAEENVSDPAMRAHCVIRIHEYQTKIAAREHEHQEWLSRMATAKQEPSNIPQKHSEAHASSQGASSSRPTAPRSQVRRPSQKPSLQRTYAASEQRAKDRVRADAERVHAPEAAARSESRAMDKAQREASKQAHLDSKAAAVRAEKENQKAKAQANAQKHADRIAKARTTGAAPLGSVGTSVAAQGKNSASVRAAPVDATPSKPVRGSLGKLCGSCGSEHATFREWRMCKSTAPVDPAAEEQSFLRAV